MQKETKIFINLSIAWFLFFSLIGTYPAIKEYRNSKHAANSIEQIEFELSQEKLKIGPEIESYERLDHLEQLKYISNPKFEKYMRLQLKLSEAESEAGNIKEYRNNIIESLAFSLLIPLLIIIQKIIGMTPSLFRN